MTLLLEVVTPVRVLVSRDVDEVIAPGVMGEFGVLTGHQDFFTAIVPGELSYRVGGETTYFNVASGFAEVTAHKVVVLVDSAERVGEIDVDRAREALRRAEERLAKEHRVDDLDTLRAEMALQRAMKRLEFVKEH